MLFADNRTLSSLHLGFSCPGKVLLYTVQNTKDTCLIRIMWFLIIMCISYDFLLCTEELSSYSLMRECTSQKVYLTKYIL